MLRLEFWNLLFTAVNILILYGLMKKFLFQPIRAVLEKREQKIVSGLAAAQQSQEEAIELKQEYERRLLRAQEEGEEILHRTRALAEKEQERLLAQAKEQVQQMKQKALAETAAEQERVREQAKEEIAKLALLAARKILEEPLKEAGSMTGEALPSGASGKKRTPERMGEM